MSKYFINLLGCLGLLMSLNAQEVESKIGDSIVVQQKYGLRLGVDLSKITRSLIEKDYMGFEYYCFAMVKQLRTELKQFRYE